MAGKAGKDWSFPRFWNTLTLSQPGGGGRLGPPYSIGPSLAQTRRGGPEDSKFCKEDFAKQYLHLYLTAVQIKIYPLDFAKQYPHI
jgi:hypothetical protein